MRFRAGFSEAHPIRWIESSNPPASLAAMTFARAHKKLTAWLGLVALALVVFAPMVSQQLVTHAALEAARHAMFCEATPTASAGSDMPAGHDMPASDHAACAYCNFLTHHVPAPAPVGPTVVAVPVHWIGWATAPVRFAVHKARRSGRPRDSPFLT